MENLSDARKFCLGLKKLSKECHMTSIEFSKLAVIGYKFEDGSSVGCIRSHIEAGLIKNN